MTKLRTLTCSTRLCQGEPLAAAMNKLAAVLALGSAGAESFVQGGTLSLDWKDCGDASTKGKVTGLAPTSLTLGKKTRVAGAGSFTEDESWKDCNLIEGVHHL